MIKKEQQKLSLNRKGLSYTHSPKWLKDKKAIINPKSNDNNSFQHVLTVTLNYQKIKSHPERISNLKPFIDQYDWKEIDFPAHASKDWKMFEQKNKIIALNIFFVPYNTEKIKLAYKSKQNFKRENQAILLIIVVGKKWHYRVVKIFPALLREITSDHKEDLHYLNCFHSYNTTQKT